MYQFNTWKKGFPAKCLKDQKGNGDMYLAVGKRYEVIETVDIPDFIDYTTVEKGSVIMVERRNAAIIHYLVTEPADRNPELIPVDDEKSEENKAEDELQKYREDLLCHDWYYDWSDDGDVWRRGRAERERLMKVAQEKGGAFMEAWEAANKKFSDSIK